MDLRRESRAASNPSTLSPKEARVRLRSWWSKRRSPFNLELQKGLGYLYSPVEIRPCCSQDLVEGAWPFEGERKELKPKSSPLPELGPASSSESEFSRSKIVVEK